MLDRHPALAVAAALAAGLHVGVHAPSWAGPAAALVGSALALVLLLAGRIFPTGRRAGQLTVVFILGIWRSSVDSELTGASPAREASLVSIRGIVERPPVEVVEDRDERRDVQSYLDLRTMERGHSVRIRCRGTLSHVRGGDLVQVAGTLLPPMGARNPGDRERPGTSLLLVSHARQIQVARSPGSLSPTTLLGRLRDRFQGVILKTHSEHLRGFILSVLLGDRRLLADDIHEALLGTGTYHLLAISGLHVGLVLFLVIRLPVPRRLRTVCRLAILLGFTLLTGANPPVVRAALMFTLNTLALHAGRSPNGLNTLGAAAVILLGVEPSLLGDVGFQLSFVAVISILTWGRRLGDRLPAGVLTSGLTVSLATCVGTAPLTLLYFQRLHPLAPIWNLLAVPLALVAVVGGLGSLLLGLLHPALGLPLAWVTDVLLEMLLAVLRFGASVPASTVLLPAPPLVFIVGALLLFFAGLCWMGRTVSLLLAPCLLLGACLQAALTPRAVEFWHFDVGEGSAALLSLPGAGAFLVDAGCRGRDSRAGAALTRTVLSTGCRSLRGAFVSHFHHDHIKALPGLTDRLRVTELWCTTVGIESAAGHALARRWNPRGPQLRTLARGATLIFPDAPAFRLEVLHPALKEQLIPAQRKNDMSLALRLRGDNSSVLLLGDLEEAGVARLLASADDLSCDVLIAPHHGHPNSLWPVILERTRAKIVVISGAGRSAARRVASSLESAGVRVLTTWRRGAVRLTWKAERGWTAAYWSGKGSLPRRSGTAGVRGNGSGEPGSVR